MAISIPLPAVCGTCRAIFPSPIVIGGNTSVSISNVGVGPCPNGHMNGFIPDGTYSLRDGIMQIVSGAFGVKSDIERIHAIAKEAFDKPPSFQSEALDQIAALLPEESRAAIKQLGSQNPMAAILVVLFLISVIANQLGDAFRAFFPSNPSPSVIINNYNVPTSKAVAPAPEDEQAINDGPAAESSKQGRVKKKRQGPTDQATKNDRLPQKPKSRRRANVRRARRADLRQRRIQFPRRRHR